MLSQPVKVPDVTSVSHWLLHMRLHGAWKSLSLIVHEVVQAS